MSEQRISHQDFIDGYKSGALKAHVNRNNSGYFFSEKGLLPDSQRKRQALLRFIFYGAVLFGIVLFFLAPWYYGVISIVFGAFMANRAQQAAMEAVLLTALEDKRVYDLAIENKTLLIQFDKTVASRDSSPADASHQEIVGAFGELIEKTADLPPAIFDTSMLPYEKSQIRDSLIAIYHNSTDSSQKNLCEGGLLELANFQDGVGPEPILGAPDLSHLSSLEDNPDALAAAVLENSQDVQTDRYAELRKVADSEFQEFLRLLKSDWSGNGSRQ